MKLVCHYQDTLYDTILVTKLFLRQDLLLGWFQEHVNTSKHHERQDDFLVITFLKGMYQYIIGYIPNEGKEAVILFGFHCRYDLMR